MCFHSLLALLSAYQLSSEQRFGRTELLGPKTKGPEIVLCQAGAKVSLKHPSPPIFGCVKPAPCCSENGKTSQGWFWVFSKKKKQNCPTEEEEEREEENTNACIHAVMLLLICWHKTSWLTTLRSELDLLPPHSGGMDSILSDNGALCSC